jgi:hypothetical protein
MYGYAGGSYELQRCVGEHVPDRDMCWHNCSSRDWPSCRNRSALVGDAWCRALLDLNQGVALLLSSCFVGKVLGFFMSLVT